MGWNLRTKLCCIGPGQCFFPAVITEICLWWLGLCLEGLRMRKLVADRWFHVCPELVSRGEVEDITALRESLFVCC